jgi:hypothetical protein
MAKENNNIRQRKYLIFFISIVVLSIVMITFRHEIKRQLRYGYYALLSRYRGGRGSGGASCKGCAVMFTDGIDVHEQAYQLEKINSQKTNQGLLQLEKKGVLQRIETNENYIVESLHYSEPLLLPKAVNFLDHLSAIYKNNCIKRGIQYIPFTISSATRSIQSVDELMDDNDNAIENSPHLHGKTIDIKYSAFNKNTEQLKVFTTTLLSLKNKNKCFVKYERNGCLHTTVN